MPSRLLTDEEIGLIRCLLLATATGQSLVAHLPDCLVEEMQDGGMGSLRFPSGAPHRRARKIAEAEFDDADGAVVSVVLNLDQFGALYELDLWKVDFSPLQRVPPAAQIRISN